jgi:plastocyanin
MERPWITRLLLVATVALTACADDSNASQTREANDNAGGATETTAGAAVAERFEIEIANFQFGPAEAVVAAGTEVVWVNADTDIHSIISTGERFASSDTFANGESYAVVFTEPGTYEYTCGVHPFMTGTVTVE